MAFHKAQCYPRCCSTCRAYSNDQPLPVATNSFIYADDLCLTTQQNTFEQVETILASGLNELGAYYKENHPRLNPAKTQLTAFHLKNRQADRTLNVTWNGTKLDHTHSPVYLGITLDRSLTYRNHCLKTRAKLSSRNNLTRKLHGTNCGACPHTMRTTATALCLSVAEYCCPVWALSTLRMLVDITLNERWRLIRGCIRPTATPDLYVLSGIAPPEIRRSTASTARTSAPKNWQTSDTASITTSPWRVTYTLETVAFQPPCLSFIAKWQEQWGQTDSNLKRYNIPPNELLPSGHTLPWRAWRTSNRVRSGQAAIPAAKHLWGYRVSKNCMCGAATCDLNHIMTSCTHFGERPCVYIRKLRKWRMDTCGGWEPLHTRHDNDLDFGQPVPLGASGDEKPPSITVTADPAGSMPANTHLSQVFFESGSPCLLRPPPLSSVVFWYPVHCCMCGSFSLQSEDVANHFPSPCSDNVLYSLHACPPHPLHLWHGRAMRCRGLYVGSGDGRHLACERSWPFSSSFTCIRCCVDHNDCVQT